MTSQERRDDALPPETVAALIHTALRRQKNGDRTGARALLRALSTQQPDEPQVWLALATVAETRAEQRLALERVIALDPQHPLAQRGLARFQDIPHQHPAVPGRPAADRTTPVLPAAEQSLPRALGAEDVPRPATTPVARSTTEEFAPTALMPAEPLASAQERRWPWYIAIAIAVFAVFVAAGLLRLPQVASVGAPAATAGLAGSAPLSPVRATVALASPAAAGNPPATTTTPISAGRATSVGAPSITSQPTDIPATASLTPQPTALPVLAPGAVVTEPPWHVSLLRPEYAVLLDGSIGELQPRGRFVLALVAVSNDGSKPARIPADLFALVDSRGQRYLAQPTVSTTYLNTYGRGQRGDLSMEEDIPPGGGIYSVPVIFDVPANVRGLTLQVESAAAGWPISATAISGAPGATPTP